MLYHIMPLERDWQTTSGTADALIVGAPRLVRLDKRFRPKDYYPSGSSDLHVHVGLDFVPIYESKMIRPEMYKALGWYMSDATDMGERVFYETLIVRVNDNFIPIRVETFSGSRIDDHMVINLNNLAELHHACGATISPDIFIDPKRSILEGDHEVCRVLNVPQQFTDVIGEAYRRSPYLKGLAYDYLSPDLAAQELSVLARVCSSRDYATPVIDRTLITTVAPLGLDPAVAVQFSNQGWCKNPSASDLISGRVPIDISRPGVIRTSELDNVVSAAPIHMHCLDELRSLGTDYRIKITTEFSSRGDSPITIDVENYVDRYGYVLGRRYAVNRIDSVIRSAIWGLRYIWADNVMSVGPIPTDVVVEIVIIKTFGDEMLIRFNTGGAYPESDLNVYVDFALRSFVSFGAAYG